jgi:hypothetical protein
VTFKSVFKTEDYLLIDLKKNDRSLLAQFRCGILPLRIETGRYVGEAVENRLCLLCDEHLVENESHFLISCKYYENLRRDCLINILHNHADQPADRQLCALVQNHPRQLAKYLTKAYLKRRNYLFRN